jgi:hypothetical protein
MQGPQVKLGLVSNVWSKMMHFEKCGDLEQGHSHKFDHITLLASGKLQVRANGKPSEFVAPNMIFIKAGVEHELTALEDNTVCYCIHAIRDGERVEDIVDPTMIPEGINALNHVEVYGSLIHATEQFLDPRSQNT